MIIRKLYWGAFAGGAVIIAGLAAGGIYYQATHFNRGATIDGVRVGGLTAERALNKLSGLTLKNDVYLGKQRIVNGRNTKSQFAANDLDGVTALLKKHFSLFPSSKKMRLSLIPKQVDSYRSTKLRQDVESKLDKMNKRLKAPVDAEARLVDGQLTLRKSQPGEKFDITKIMKAYDQEDYHSVIYLKPVRVQPILASSATVTKEKAVLKNLLSRSTDYTLQDKQYPFAAAALIQNASVTKTMKVAVDTSGIKKKLAQINQKTSTLNKNYTFKTHTGKVISVKGQSYGWALHVPAEAKRIANALIAGKKAISAYNVYGTGFSTYGIGYKVRGNNGIGSTYAEVSISEQRIWLYRNGQMVLTTNVVTGRHDTHEDTPPGVWYIEYKQSPSVLEGSEAGDPNYKVKVKYWAPFTLSGCGFHDAPWRHNWSGSAYLTQGSGGCVNTPPNVMASVYNQLEQNEPVIVY
ncbi:MAG: L,D-transpeptidase family protein [Sporolactobacillus sp.]